MKTRLLLLTTLIPLGLLSPSLAQKLHTEAPKLSAEETVAATSTAKTIGRTVFKGFSERKLELWDEIISKDVIIRSTIGEQPMKGLEALKAWGGEFPKAFDARIDLVDEIYAPGRAIIAVNLHWRHNKKFFDLEPTGKSGTSIEYFIMTIENGKVTKFWVADHTLDITTYLTVDRGMPSHRTSNHNRSSKARIRSVRVSKDY